ALGVVAAVARQRDARHAELAERGRAVLLGQRELAQRLARLALDQQRGAERRVSATEERGERRAPEPVAQRHLGARGVALAQQREPAIEAREVGTRVGRIRAHDALDHLSPGSSSAGSIASGVPRALSTGARSATAWLYSRSSESTRACLTAACRAAGDPPPTFCASSNCVRASSRSPWARAASPLTMSTHARAPGSSCPPSNCWYTGSASTGLPASTAARARRNSIGNAS